MDLVDDIDFVVEGTRRELHGFPQLSNIIHTRIRSGVDLDDIQRPIIKNIPARIAFEARLAVFEMLTIDCFGKNPRN